MSSVRLVAIQEDGARVNFHVNLDSRGSSGYETDVDIYEKEEGWVAEIKIEDMPPQSSPEEAADRLSLYLEKLSKAIKGKNIKHLNIDSLFKPVYKR